MGIGEDADVGIQDSTKLFGSILDGLTLTNTTYSDVTPSCSTGNCTWKAYSSLAVCPRVIDVSSSLTNAICNTTAFDEIFDSAGLENPGFPCFNYTLPQLTYSATISPGVNVSLSDANLDGERSLGLGLMQVMGLYYRITLNSSALFTAYVVYQPDLVSSINSSLPAPVAYELGLDFCVQTYNTTVTKGVVNTETISTRNLETDYGEIYYGNNNSDTFLVASDYFNVSVGGDVFGVSAIAIEGLYSVLQGTIFGECFLSPPAYDTPSLICDTFINYPFLNASLSTDPLSNLTKLWTSLAISLTNQ